MLPSGHDGQGVGDWARTPVDKVQLAGAVARRGLVVRHHDDGRALFVATGNTMGARTFGDGKSGLYVLMQSSDINGQLPNDRTQCGCVPFSLAQAADGSIQAILKSGETPPPKPKE